MRCVVQRVRRGAVTIDGGERREIGRGLVLLLGVHASDTERDADYLAEKVAGLRIFPDAEGKMNFSVSDIAPHDCLVISQFTLYGDARRGKRPSFVEAAPPDVAIPLYERFCYMLSRQGEGFNRPRVVTGEFGADMLVEIENEGPVTILLDSGKAF